MSGLRVGGKERVVLQLAQAARRAGHDVTLITHDAPRARDHAFDASGLDVIPLERGSGFDFRFVRNLARCLREGSFDVLHAHADTALVYGAAACLVARKVAPALVGTFHVRPSYATPRARWITREAARRATITVVSDSLKDFLADDRWIDTATTIGNGVDPSVFCPGAGSGAWRERLGAEASSVVVAHVGRFDPIKQQEVLRDAVRALRHEGLDVRAIFAGDGPTRARFESALTSEDAIVVVPHVDDVTDLLRDVDLLALCSEHEASPCVVLEALACGVPVVSTDVGDVAEVLGDPPAGRIAPDAPAFTNALRELVTDPELRPTLSKLALVRARSFDVNATWRAYLDVYRGAL